jgi:hypothetical protein
MGGNSISWVSNRNFPPCFQFAVVGCRWLPFAAVDSCSPLLDPVRYRWIPLAIVGSGSLSLVPVHCYWLLFAVVGSLSSCIGPSRHFGLLAFIGLEFLSLGRLIVIVVGPYCDH